MKKYFNALLATMIVTCGVAVASEEGPRTVVLFPWLDKTTRASLKKAAKWYMGGYGLLYGSEFFLASRHNLGNLMSACFGDKNLHRYDSNIKAITRSTLFTAPLAVGLVLAYEKGLKNKRFKLWEDEPVE